MSELILKGQKAKEASYVLMNTSTTDKNNALLKMAEKLLDKAKVDYKFIDAEENVELTKTLNITQAPTLVVVKDNKVELVENVSNIRRYIETSVMR